MITFKRWQRPGVANVPDVGTLLGLGSELGRLFENQIGEFNNRLEAVRNWNLPVDVYEDTENLFVKAELPGLKKEDIDVSLEDGVLTVSGERKAASSPTEAKTHRSERFVGKFQRAIILPTEVKPDAVNAHYENGVLTVTLPKAEAAKPKQININ